METNFYSTKNFQVRETNTEQACKRLFNPVGQVRAIITEKNKNVAARWMKGKTGNNHFVSDDLKTMPLPHSGMGARLSPFSAGGGWGKEEKSHFYSHA